jgi:DNA repair ATPase RecN
VAREDRIAAPQMKRLQGLQAGLLESWELLPEGYGPLLDEDIFTVVGEIEEAARLARRRAALRRHLGSVDRREISRRIEGLEQDLAGLEEGSPMRAPFERALEGRREELASGKDILEGISMINAQLEDTESLLSNLRAELLALDTSPTSGTLEPGLAHLKESVSYFRRSMDEVRRSVEALPVASAERLSAPDERKAPRY